MNCRTFELQVADWLSGRLPDNISVKMAEHKAICPPCARIAEAEADLQGRWSAWQMPEPSADLWPKIAARLDAETTSRPRQAIFDLSRLTAWMSSGPFGYNPRAFATAACVVAILVPVAICTTVLTRPVNDTAGAGSESTTTSAQPNTTRTRTAVVPPIAYTLIDDAGQGDPSIDDPIGGTMEHVWTHVSTDNKDTASR
jgi:hypothetical protein